MIIKSCVCLQQSARGGGGGGGKDGTVLVTINLKMNKSFTNNIVGFEQRGPVLLRTRLMIIFI